MPGDGQDGDGGATNMVVKPQYKEPSEHSEGPTNAAFIAKPVPGMTSIEVPSKLELYNTGSGSWVDSDLSYTALSPMKFVIAVASLLSAYSNLGDGTNQWRILYADGSYSNSFVIVELS